MLHWQQRRNFKSNLTKHLSKKQQSTGGPVAMTSIFDLARVQRQVQQEATEKLETLMAVSSEWQRR